MKVSLVFIFFLIWANQAHAFVDQFLFFDDREISEINRASLIDGEYYSDVLAYRLSSNNQLKFFQSKEAYDISVGSMNSTQFISQQRLKLDKEITKKLHFNLFYAEKDDFELLRSHLLPGLRYEINKTWFLSASTSLFSEKSQNDLRFAVGYGINPFHKISFFYTLTDFSFNERTRTNNKNLKATNSFGIIGRVSSDASEFMEYYLIRNTELNRLLSDSGSIYTFQETRLGIRGIKALRSFKINYEIDLFDGKEGLLSGQSDQPVERSGARILSQVQRVRWIFGLEYNYRSWRETAGNVHHRNYMPHLWYHLPLGSKLESIDLGLESSIHEARGDLSLRKDSDQEDSVVNSRFNLRLNFPFSKKAFLNLLLSLDLDDGSWEGGGGQFQMIF
jgi:hypothetical protein